MQGIKILEVSGLTAGYGDLEVLKGINLEVREGEVVAIFGSNGSGKSTFLKVVAGLLGQWGGTVRFRGEVIDGLPPQERVRKGISLAIEGRKLFLGMTVEENLIVGAWVNKKRVSENLEKVYSYFPQLWEKRRSLAGDLSGGQQQMLSIGRALMSSPTFLMIDELSLGLAPKVVDTLAEILIKIKEEEKISMLIVEQEVSLALDISQRAYVFDFGEVVDEGASPELMERDSIRRAYLSL
jgi:branched-chain amino acid transport system ATP-binding protein